MKKNLIGLFLVIMSSTLLPAQTFSDQKLKVFVDCTSTWCDMQFIRTEINTVDFLLDRVASDVHILVTSIQNGSGGRQYQLIFYGQHSFKNVRDTLKFSLQPNFTDFEQRDRLIKFLKLGLGPMVAKTNQADLVMISMKSETDSASAKTIDPTKDKWNYWVFRFGFNGSLELDKVYKSSSLNGNFSINRTTDEIRTYLTFYAGNDRSSYEYDTDTGPLKVIVENQDYGIEHLLVKSISRHWSYGYETNFLQSTFRNYSSQIVFLPQLEYSIFPYSDVNTRFFTVRYGIGLQHNAYYVSTIYDQTEELLWGHSAKVNLSFNQKWGTINTGISYRNYFHDWQVNNLGINSEIDVRITGGLSAYAYIFGGLAHDQINLEGEGATEEEVLSRRRQLQSSYNFNAYFGVSYRFGSKLNNFVNPRFKSFD